jgi:hypothetical protein
MAAALTLMLGLAGCNPYDPAQRAVGGGLYGAAMGAAIGAAATGGPGAPLGAAAGAAAGVLMGIASTPPAGYYGYPGGYYGYPGYNGYQAGYGYPGYAPQAVAAAPAGPATAVASPSAAPDCRKFSGDATIDASRKPFYGSVCLEADGRWHIVP